MVTTTQAQGVTLVNQLQRFISLFRARPTAARALPLHIVYTRNTLDCDQSNYS